MQWRQAFNSFGMRAWWQHMKSNLHTVSILPFLLNNIRKMLQTMPRWINQNSVDPHKPKYQ